MRIKSIPPLDLEPIYPEERKERNWIFLLKKMIDKKKKNSPNLTGKLNIRI